jgi:glycerate kinase
LPAIDVLRDVDNPLYGPTGAACVYARQKGANENEVAILDAGLRHFANCAAQTLGHGVSPDTPGAGAAGGVAYTAMAFLNARLHRGIAYLMQATRFDSAVEQADVVLTGEGHLDAQTLYGKLIHGVCERARHLRRPVIALCGKISASADQLRELGLLRAYDINEGATARDAIAKTAERLAACAARISLTD